MRMGVTAVALVMAVHWMSCCWVMLSTPPAAGQYTTWWELWSNAQAPPDAISADGIGVVYLWALYFTISIITTAGFGDLRVANEHEACFMALILVISIVLQGSLVANMSTLILSSDSTRNLHKHKTETMKAYLKHMRVPEETYTRVLNYLDYLWASSKGLDESALIATLPATLQEAITLSTNQQIITKVPLFEGCSDELCAFIIRNLVTHTFLPGDYVCRAGDEGDQMMLINRGVVQILKADAQDVFLSEGEYFGELCALVGGVRTHDVVAFSHCHIYALDHATLETLFQRNPKSIENLISNLAEYADIESVFEYVAALGAAPDAEAAAPSPEDA